MTGIRHRQIRKFSPGTYQSDEEVKEQFVVRSHELDVLLHVLRGNFHSPSCQHALIVAPRGRGKTMLLARVAAEIHTSAEFCRHFLPVRFMEESLEIFSLTDFWLETLFHLARECASLDPQLADELHDSHAALSEHWREQSLEDHVRAVVLDAADRLGLKLVLMVENLQALCKDVDAGFGWKLREVLQTEPQIILLASATTRFAGLDDAEQPFFEMFRTIDLKPLTTEQCRNLWELASGDKMTGREIRPLEIITGGSPRLLVIIAGFEQHKSLRRLMEELVMLIDEHTEYFRGNLDAIGRTERRVYIAVLDLWQNSTPGEIAARARMDVRVASTMLGRLVERGALVVEGGGRKRKYAAAEPLHCIYYKLRRGRDEAAVVENLIRFMEAFYSSDELREFGARMVQEVQEFDGNALAVYWSAFERLVELPSLGDYRKELLFLAGESAASSSELSTVREMLASARAFTSSGKLDAAERIWDEVIQRFGRNNAPEHLDKQLLLAQALSDKGAMLIEVERTEEALVILNDIVRRFVNNQTPQIQSLVACALLNSARAFLILNRPKKALKACGKVLKRFGKIQKTFDGELAIAMLGQAYALIALDRNDQALDIYDEVLQRFGNGDESTVAHTLLHKGLLLSLMHRDDEARAAWNEVVRRFEASDRPMLRDAAEDALYWQARYELTGAGRESVAIAFLDRALLRERAGRPGTRLHSHLLRAQAHLAIGDNDACADDVEAALSILPELDMLSKDELVILAKLSTGIGAERMRGLIDSSSASDILLPLKTALERELGLEPRVAREVEKVADDIRRELFDLRNIESGNKR